MKRRPSNNQSGFALILLVVTLMAVGGLLLVGYSEAVLDQVESSRFEHNKRVLEEAKLALLQSAYNYPVTNNLGPGRLPNADTDNDGTADGGSTFGRLPWNQPNLNLYDIRDADGQRLWYAVSSSFRPQTDVINSDTSGGITLRDQSGNVIFDGSNPADLNQYGVAAVIIAPGAVIDRNGVSQDRSAANVNDPAQYLDLVVGTEDNAGFTNGDATDGFILGPVNNLTNDQFIVITAAEVIEVAEKATLQAYQTAIEDYLGETGDVYPYLFNYLPSCFGGASTGAETTAAACAGVGGTWRAPYVTSELTSLYPASLNFDDEINSDFLGACFGGAEANRTDCETAVNVWKAGYKGRIPSLFAEYFTETDSQPIETVLSGSLGITFPVAGVVGLTYTQLTKRFLVPEADVNPPAEFQFNDYPTPPFQTTRISEVSFVDLANPGEGQLKANFVEVQPPITLDMYFWDDDEGPATGVWTACADDGNNIAELSDCHRGPNGTHIFNMEILHVVVTLDFPATPGDVNFDMNYSPPPTILVVPATSDSHARIMAAFDSDDIINGTMLTVSGGTYEYDPHYHVGFALGEQNDGAFRAGSVDTADFILDELTLGIRYYPELPGWAFDNGWHDSMMMAYSPEYLPGEDQACDAGVDCLEVPNSRGPDDNKIAILISAGQHDWVDENNNGFSDDVIDVFEPENADLDDVFEWPSPPRGDNMLILSP